MRAGGPGWRAAVERGGGDRSSFTLHTPEHPAPAGGAPGPAFTHTVTLHHA